MVNGTRGGLAAKRPEVLSKVPRLDLVLGVGGFSPLPRYGQEADKETGSRIGANYGLQWLISEVVKMFPQYKLLSLFSPRRKLDGTAKQRIYQYSIELSGKQSLQNTEWQLLSKILKAKAPQNIWYSKGWHEEKKLYRAPYRWLTSLLKGRRLPP